MKTTKVLTLTKLYDFERTPWPAHGVMNVTIMGEAVGDDGTIYCIESGCRADNEERREADLANLIECEAQFFVEDEKDGEKMFTGKGMPKLKVLGFPNGPGQFSEGLKVLSGEPGTRTVSRGSIPSAQTGAPAAAVDAGGSLPPAPAHTALLAAATFLSNSGDHLEDDVLLLAERWEIWLAGEKTRLGAGEEGHDSGESDSEPAPTSSGWGDDAAAAPPQSDPPSETDGMWDLAMEEFGVGSRAPVIVALRKMLERPIDTSAVTVQELADVIVWHNEPK